MIFIDFGLLRNPYCKISYLLKSADVTQIWWRHLLKRLQMLAKIFVKRLQTFLFFFYVFNVFFILIWTFITSMDLADSVKLQCTLTIYSYK